MLTLNWFKKTSFSWLLLALTLGIYPVNNFPILSAPLLAQSFEDFKRQADQLEREGIKLIQAGKPQEGVQLWQQALQIYTQIQDQQSAARLLYNFGKLFIQFEDYATAIEYLRTSLAIAISTEDVPNAVSISVDIAQSFRYLKNYEQAMEYYVPALELARQINDVDNGIIAIGGMGKIYEAQGKFDQAIQAYQEAVKIAYQTKNSKFAIIALGSLGDIAKKQEKYSLSNSYYTELLKIAQQVKDVESQIAAAQSLGTNYYFARNCAHAEAFFEISLSLAKQINNSRDQKFALQNGGNAAYCQGKMDIALKNYEAALAIAKQKGDESEIGQLIGNIGLVNVHLGNYQKAVDYLKQDIEIARKFGNKKVEGQALGSLGDAYYFQKNYPEALSFYEQSLAIAKQVNYKRGEALMLMNIGRVLQLLNRLPDAEKNLKASINIQNAIESKSLNTGEDTIAIFEFHRRSYRLLQNVLIAQNKVEEALTIAEAGRAKTFAQELGNKVNKSFDNRNLDLAGIKAIARQKNATIVEYSVIYDQNQEKETDTQIFIWVVKPNGEVNFASIPLTKVNSSLPKLVGNYRQAMGVRGRQRSTNQTNTSTNSQNDLQQLYQLLIQPIEQFLPSQTESEIIFIPQEELFLVPFVALQDQQNNYLIDKYTIQTAPSIQVLALTSQRRQEIQSTGEALVVGNPDMPTVYSEPDDGEKLIPLPGTEVEANKIASILNTQAVIGTQATKANVIKKMETANVIHLATHGLLDVDSQGMLDSYSAGYQGIGGAIALAPTKEDNGLLNVLEITELNLPAELVILSACDTGRGKITGDGVLGLSRSFLAAGASGVVVSLWSVPDAPTAELMIEFYQEWKKTGNKAKALRQAMLKVKKSNPEPVNWAAFTFIGESE